MTSPPLPFDEPNPFDELLRQKLVSLITAADLTLETASVQLMGKSESWLRRRLGAPAGTRQNGHDLTHRDVTRILRAMRIHTDRLLDPTPILVEGDVEGLRLLVARRHVPATMRRQLGFPRLQRLQAQGLVGKDLRLTAAGLAILAAANTGPTAEIESPLPSGDATGAPADWIQHDITPAEEGWFIVALWPGVELDDTVLDVGYVARHVHGYLYMQGRIDSLRGLDGALYVRLPRPIHLPF